MNLNNEIYCEGENVSFTFFLSDNLTAPLPITYTTQNYDISGAPDGPAEISGINPQDLYLTGISINPSLL